MIIFSVPKPFRGEFAEIQKNAIESWQRIIPKPTIVVCGDEVGTQEMVKRYKLAHMRTIKTNERGVPQLDYIFNEIQKRYHDDLYLYVNSDIIFLDSPEKIVKPLSRRFSSFLAIGQRFEMASTAQMKERIREGNVALRSASWMDYFIFTPGVFSKIPPFLLGRTFWDKWLVWSAIQNRIPVVDVTEDLHAVHQSHSYSFSSTTNRDVVWAGQDTLRNIVLAGGWSHSADISLAQYKLRKGRLIRQKTRVAFHHLLRRIMDKLPFMWPLFLRVRLLRQQMGSIMDQK